MERRILVDKTDNPHPVITGTREGAVSILIGYCSKEKYCTETPGKNF